MSEEWVDCTKELFPTSKGHCGWYYRRECGLYFIPNTDPMAGIPSQFRVYINGSQFRIERRVEKKYCPACGQEVKK